MKSLAVLAWRSLAVIACAVCTIGGCNADLERMIDQARYDVYQQTPYFPNGTIMQLPPPGTVHSAQLQEPAPCLECMDIPIPLTAELMARGRNRFEVYCAACHGLAADGRSKVAQKMTLRPAPSLHTPKYRAYPAGRFYAVITGGYGLMRSYAPDLSISDRWAVVAYVQALQLSQYARLGELPPAMREEARAWLSK
jgi:mono/diheme cytochrome c family protein